MVIDLIEALKLILWRSYLRIPQWQGAYKGVLVSWLNRVSVNGILVLCEFGVLDYVIQAILIAKKISLKVLSPVYFLNYRPILPLGSSNSTYTWSTVPFTGGFVLATRTLMCRTCL